MDVNDFEEKLKEELKNLNILLLDIYSRRRFLCVDWSFDEGRKFVSAFLIDDSYLQDKPDDVLYKMVKSILYSLSHPDNLVSEITKIERLKRSRK